MAYDFKKEEDVKQFLENLRMEYRFGCFSEKNPEVCHLLGDYFDNIDRDYDKAAKVYQTNCDDYKYPRSCYRFGAYSALGKGSMKRNVKQGYDYFEKGCNVGSPEACLQQGLLLCEDNPEYGVKFDPIEGLEKLAKACELKNDHACFSASSSYISGIPKAGIRQVDVDLLEKEESYVVKKDFKNAFKYAMDGCNLGHLYCCQNLSRMYQRGDGVEKNEELAMKYKRLVDDMYDEMTSNYTLKFGQGLAD